MAYKGNNSHYACWNVWLINQEIPKQENSYSYTYTVKYDKLGYIIIILEIYCLRLLFYT